MTTWLSQVFHAFARPLRWWVVVAPWERGVRVRLGKSAKELRPGPHFRIPFLDRVYVQSVRLRTLTMMNQTISTKDGKPITVSWGLQFAITNMLRLYDSVANPEQTLRTLVESKVAEHIAATDLGGLSPRSIERSVNGELETFEDWGLGRLQCFIVGFASLRTYRLLMNDYQASASLDSIDGEHQAGER